MKKDFFLGRLCLMLCLLTLQLNKAYATHIYGADLFYTHSSGNTYNISLVIYGDCGGAALSNLYGASPTVDIYNGSTYVTSISLTQQGASVGVEVTPVCPSQLSNTNCVSTSGTVPGVKKFTYVGSYTLSTTSSNWRFRFDGVIGSGGGAGRSTSITNIVSGTSGTIMALEATLNNNTANNSSPLYTTIPTPFFCAGIGANYNPGTVDPNGDSLSYSLVPGLLGGSGGTVTYLTGYSATAPLSCSTGTFSFSATTGQLSFTPNIVQRSLVVNKIEEYRGGVLVGTSMREMTFVVLSSCSGNPPTGAMSSASAGTLNSAGTILNVCKSSGTLTFSLNPTDPEGDTINMQWSGIPAGATFSVSNNNTTAPTGSFSWNLSTVAPGSYNFFITYTDNGCPLSSRQTLVYTIVVLPEPTLVFSLVYPATCTKKAVFDVTPGVSPSPWAITILQGATTIHSFTGLTGTQRDSLSPGTYTFRTRNSNTCFKDTSIVIAPPPVIVPVVSLAHPSCHGSTNGSITITGTGGKTPFTYAIGSGAYSATNTFTGLAAGTYTLHILDSNDCLKDTTVTLMDPPDIVINVASAKPKCNYYNSGLITFTASNGVSPYQYVLGSGSFSSANSFAGLFSGTYVLHVKDGNNCTKDSTFILRDSIVVHATASVTNVLCNGANTGAITITGNGGNSPYMYKIGSGTLTSTNTFTSLLAGTYNVHVQDVDSCYLDTPIAIIQPVPITINPAITNVSCYGLSNGSVTVGSAGGTGTHTYAIGTGTYSSSNTFNGLAVGNYTLHVKDANNCIKDTTITITQPPVLAITNVNLVQPICNGSSTGFIIVGATGGTTPYSYALDANPFGTSSSFGNVAAGTYVVHLKDANNCTRDTTVTLGQPTPIVPFIQIKKSTCTPLNNGRVDINAAGGVPGYTYAMGTGAFSTVNTFTGLAAGSYLLRIKDNKTCVKDTLINIVDSLTVTATYAISNVKCFTESSGSVTVTTLTGISPFTYAANSNAYGSSNVLGNLAAGNHMIKIKDALGCTKDTTLPVTEPTLLVPFVTSTHVTCFGTATGSVTISGSGGTTPYAFAKGTGSYVSSGNFTGLTAGTYVFHIKDANNCTRDTTITITEPTKLRIDTLLVKNATCYGDKDGSVTIIGSGGTPAYTYSNNGTLFTTNNLISNLATGPYIITLKDNNGCRVDTMITIKQPDRLGIDSVHIISPTCEGFTDATVTIFGKGGTVPYQYAVGNNAFTPDNTFNGLSEGSHTFSVIDANNCRFDTVITLIGYPHIEFAELNINPVKCYGFTDGQISVKAMGGNIPYRFKLGTASAVPESVFSNLPAGTYLITIIDNKGCEKDTAINITSPEKLKIEMTAVPNDCEGYDNEGVVHAEVTGGTMPYYYKWSDPKESNSEDLKGAQNGKYMVWVTDVNSCKDSAVSEVLYDDCCKIFIPDAFTPNGDGKNDYAKVLFKGDFKLERFAIYNRFGQQVFETNDPSQGWNGIFKGVPQDLGVYNYYAKGICGNSSGRAVEYKGTITLIK
ncbi:MAG TPA: gliding motility-associated C-terminal domain-containing protein [Flavipsychrobacter sp.]